MHDSNQASRDDRWCSSDRGLVRVELDGFPPSGITKRVTLHAATRRGGHDVAGRDALLKYILRPAVAQESPFGDHEARRVTPGPDGLVRITLKKPFSDGTVAVDMDPLSLLSRLAASPFGDFQGSSVPAPRLSPFGDHEARHAVRYAGVLASASPPSGITKRVKLRARLAPKPAVPPKPTADVPEQKPRPLQLNATSRVSSQLPHLSRAKPWRAR